MSSDHEGQGSDRRRRKHSADEKYQAVLRVLAGEDMVHLATELQVSFDRVRAWRDAFVIAGRQALAEGTYHHSRSGSLSGRLRRIQKKVTPWVALLFSLTVILWMITRYMANSSEP